MTIRSVLQQKYRTFLNIYFCQKLTKTKKSKVKSVQATKNSLFVFHKSERERKREREGKKRKRKHNRWQSFIYERIVMGEINSFNRKT